MSFDTACSAGMTEGGRAQRKKTMAKLKFYYKNT